MCQLKQAQLGIPSLEYIMLCHLSSFCLNYDEHLNPNITNDDFITSV